MALERGTTLTATTPSGGRHHLGPSDRVRLTRGLYSRTDLVQSLLIALVVGSILVYVNLGPDELFQPWSAPGEYLRYFSDFLIPFVVASASAILANRARVPIHPRS